MNVIPLQFHAQLVNYDSLEVIFQVKAGWRYV